MRLTKLKIAGFKSFVDPTTVTFPRRVASTVCAAPWVPSAIAVTVCFLPLPDLHSADVPARPDVRRQTATDRGKPAVAGMITPPGWGS